MVYVLNHTRMNPKMPLFPLFFRGFEAVFDAFLDEFLPI